MTRHLASTALLALALTACGGSRASGGSDLTLPKDFDACSVLTFERATAIAGRPVAGITSTLDDAQGRSPLMCPYNAGTIEQPQMVSLELRPAVSPDSASRRMESARPHLERIAKTKAQPVEGLGEEAYWIVGLQQMHVRKGSVQVVATVQSGDAPLDDARKLANEAFAAIEKASAEAKKQQEAAAAGGKS
ncbi:MAG TPA: hypothetical protein VJ885_19875 [Thermoanaerobaculia bacterium]|nr:hypothetical protein [Thermoanaerobaculia bacterium]